MESPSWNRKRSSLVCAANRCTHIHPTRSWSPLSLVPQTDAYERLWYLVVPPVMTLLDDFEAGYKLLGIQVVNAMLEHVPFALLNRTGISELILTV
jgi:Tti2 family